MMMRTPGSMCFAACGVVSIAALGAIDMPPGEQWPMVAHDYANTRFSPLEQITRENVKQLKVSWTFDMGVERGQEAAPIVIGDTMYVVAPYPNYLYALNLSDGSMKWKYEPKPESAAQGVACCDVVNRGCAVSDGVVVFNTLDAHTIGVDAATGKELWNTKMGEVNRGETMTMAPIIIKGKAIVGNSGGEFGVRGWLAGVDVTSGQVAWRAYSTGPDADCLIGSRFKPFYESDQGKDLGVNTWPPEQWKLGGGTCWGFIAYDPELDLLYHGTANPGEWNHELRRGDNKWSCGVFARRPDSGEAMWYYQWSPHDLYDWDGINENVLAELEIDGRARRVLMHPDRNGHFYVVDRTTGQVLSATAFVRNTATLGVDLKTGRLLHNPEKQPRTGKVIRDIQPFAPGAKDWQPMAYSPKTKLAYIPHQNLAMDFEGLEANYIAGTPYVGAETKYFAGPGGNRGVFGAWDPVGAKMVWSIPEDFPVWSGAMVTAGDVVFYGTMEGWFKALDAKTGEELWRFKTGSGIIGQAISYKAPDGKQYIAVLSGVGGWAGAVVSAGLDTRDASAALGFANAMKDLAKVTTRGGTLYVFALP